MTQVPRVRTTETRFENLKGYPFAPNYLEIEGLRVHFLDEGTATNGTMLLLHGEPTWSFLYRNLIPVFVKAGYRVIAPDMIGFGRSDKVTDENWYVLDAHISILRGLIEGLDLTKTTMVAQDWGGPYGLINAMDMPQRFARLIILNTWLHHEAYAYTDALKHWNLMSQRPELDFANMGSLPFGPSPDSEEVVTAGYRAPFEGPETQVGARRWPWMLPFMNPVEGGAVRQAKAFAALAKWDKPAHVMFGELDQVFNVDWGAKFAAHIPGATYDVIKGSAHMVQESGAPLAELILKRISEEMA